MTDKERPKPEPKDRPEKVKSERPNVSTVTPDDYPADDGGKPDYRKPGRS